MNSYKYVDLIQKKVIPDMKKAFPDRGGIFQQDLAPRRFSEIHIKCVRMAWKFVRP